ncbi:MAG: type III secretion system export apparatus subunit SctS [Myxococcota bacterium]
MLARIHSSPMDGAELTRLTAEALYLVLLVSAPALLVALVVGFIIALLQAVTQVQEQTLSFVPKLVAVGGALVAFGGWMGAQLLRFTESLWTALPTLI